MATDDLTRLSRRVAYLLRHNPSAAGLQMAPGGWIDLADLAAACDGAQRVTVAVLERLVAEDAKGRYVLRAHGHHTQIRAAQGHSLPVELGLAAQVPPGQLWHGTVGAALDGIFARGLHPQARQHVHLSADPATARTVGARRGRPVVLAVDAAAAHADGLEFYRADNGVWLCTHVPPQYLSLTG